MPYDLTHPHGTDTTAGYSIVLTDWSGATVTRYEVATTDGATSYGRALDLVRQLRSTCDKAQYGVIDTIYECGCRSADVDGTLADYLPVAR